MIGIADSVVAFLARLFENLLWLNNSQQAMNSEVLEMKEVLRLTQHVCMCLIAAPEGER